jgi:hypothetical protein
LEAHGEEYISEQKVSVNNSTNLGWVKGKSPEKNPVKSNFADDEFSINQSKFAKSQEEKIQNLEKLYGKMADRKKDIDTRMRTFEAEKDKLTRKIDKLRHFAKEGRQKQENLFVKQARRIRNSETNAGKPEKKKRCCGCGANPDHNHLKFTGTAIVVFESQNQRNEILEYYKTNWLQHLLKSFMKTLGVIKAWEPPKEKIETPKIEETGQTQITSGPPNLKSPNSDQDPGEFPTPQKKKPNRCLKKCFDVKKIYGEDADKYLSVDVVEPPEPSDIVWEHIGYRQLWWFSALIKLLVLGLLGLFFWLIYLILKAKQSLVDETPKDETEKDEGLITLEMLLNISLGAGVSATNAILSAAFRKIGALERAWTHTSYNYNLATRISLGQWLNGTVAVIVATMLLYSEDDQYKSRIFPTSGLVIEGAIIMMANWFVHPWLIVFNPLTF